MKTIPTPRIFDKRVSIFEPTRIADGFGGFTTDAPTFITKRWCYVRKLTDVQLGQFRDEYGIATDVELKRFTFREFAFDRQKYVLAYQNNFFNPLVVNPNDEYEVSIDVIAVNIGVPDFGASAIRQLQDGDFRLLEDATT